MRVCLVSAPTIAEFGDLEPAVEEVAPRVPLGALALAAVLERAGLRPQVADLDVAYGRWKRRTTARGDFAVHVADELASRDAEVYGFGSICSSYPLTLRIATALRAARPGCRIVLGGPQATASAHETLAAFPAVDVVVRGEGEGVLPALVGALAGSGDLSRVPSLTYRSPRGLAQTAGAPLVDDLDTLPLPAYHLAESLRYGDPVPIEVGRGCPFVCTFCSTNRFFGRRFRMKSPARIVADMVALGKAFGTRKFDLVHDNFTVDRRVVLAFCEALTASGAGFRWTCSSRTDTIDEELVDTMWRAGCRGCFFGIESGSPEMQRQIRKRLDLGRARERLARVSQRRMTSTLSFITGFPEEREEDLRATVELFLEALRHDFLEPQLALLSPLTGTPLHALHRAELVLDDIVSDMAFQGEAHARADRALVERHPAIFSSFYSIPTRFLQRRELDDLRGFLIAARFELRWLLLAAAQLSGGGLEAFRAFRAWRDRGRPARTPGALGAYYRSRAFKRDFVRFARERLSAEHPGARRALLDLARYYASLLRKRPVARAPANPVLARDIHVTRTSSDAAALIACVRAAGDLSRVPRRPSTVVTRHKNGRHELLQLGEEAADLLRLCDGTRDLSAMFRQFRRRHPEVAGASADEACAYGLASFERRRLIARRPAARASAQRRVA